MVKSAMTALVVASFFAILSGCATKLTVGDGRELDSQLVASMRDFGEAAAEVRPAIVRSAALVDSGCDTQYELPFDAVTTYGADEDTKVAWVRALGMDPRAGLSLHGKLVAQGAASNAFFLDAKRLKAIEALAASCPGSIDEPSAFNQFTAHG